MVVPFTEVQETGRGTGFGVGSVYWKSWLPNINSIIDSTVLCCVTPNGGSKLKQNVALVCRIQKCMDLDTELLASSISCSYACLLPKWKQGFHGESDAWWACGANLSVTFPLSPLGCEVCFNTCATHPLPSHPAGAGPFPPFCTHWTVSISCSCVSGSSWHMLSLSSLLSTLHLTPQEIFE